MPSRKIWSFLGAALLLGACSPHAVWSYDRWVDSTAELLHSGGGPLPQVEGEVVFATKGQVAIKDRSGALHRLAIAGSTHIRPSLAGGWSRSPLERGAEVRATYQARHGREVAVEIQLGRAHTE